MGLEVEKWPQAGCELHYMNICMKCAASKWLLWSFIDVNNPIHIMNALLYIFIFIIFFLLWYLSLKTQYSESKAKK